MAQHTGWLDACKREFLPSVEHITINYHDLLTNPRKEIERVCLHLGLKPTDQQKEAAAGVVRPELQHYEETKDVDTGEHSESEELATSKG